MKENNAMTCLYIIRLPQNDIKYQPKTDSNRFDRIINRIILSDFVKKEFLYCILLHYITAYTISHTEMLLQIS